MYPRKSLLDLKPLKSGLAKVSIYEKRRPLIYQDQLLKAQEEAKINKRGVWNLAK